MPYLDIIDIVIRGYVHRVIAMQFANCIPRRRWNMRVQAGYRAVVWWCALLQLRHHERDGASNHRRLDCLLNSLFSRRSKKTSKLRVTGLCAGNSPVNGEFSAQRASNAENVSIWLSYHVKDARENWYRSSWFAHCRNVHNAIKHYDIMTLNVMLWYLSPNPLWLDIWDDTSVQRISTLRPRQNCRHFVDDISKCIFLGLNIWIVLKMSLKFVPKIPITKVPA